MYYSFNECRICSGNLFYIPDLDSWCSHSLFFLSVWPRVEIQQFFHSTEGVNVLLCECFSVYLSLIQP